MERLNMRFVSFFKLCAVVALLGGCAIHQSEQEKHIAFLSASVTPEKGMTTRDVALRGNLAVEATKGSGADIGMAALMLLNSGSFQKTAAKHDHLEVWMPVSEASEENDAKLKMSKILVNSINKTFVHPYETKLDEATVEDDRFIRINGPSCENWSCIVNGSFPSKTARKWEGNMLKYDHQTLVAGNQCPCYVYEGLSGGFAFYKLIKDYRGNPRFEAQPTSFGGEDFYTRLSANLPDWAYYYVAKQPPGTDMKVPALFNKGKRVN